MCMLTLGTHVNMLTRRDLPIQHETREMKKKPPIRRIPKAILIVTTSKALVTTSVALVTTSKALVTRSDAQKFSKQ